MWVDRSILDRFFSSSFTPSLIGVYGKLCVFMMSHLLQRIHSHYSLEVYSVQYKRKNSYRIFLDLVYVEFRIVVLHSECAPSETKKGKDI